MRILGIAGLIHDPSVALLVDGKIVFALESEKITRHKHEISVLPEEAIRFLLEYSRTQMSEVDHIATNWAGGPIANQFYLPFIQRCLQRWCFPLDWIPVLIMISRTHAPNLWVRLQEYRIPPITQIPHHLAHVGSSYTLSSFDEAAVAVVDGSGELSCTSLYHCTGRRIRKLYSMDLPLDSLGHLYTAGTIHLGFRMLGDEYKVMGLAAYGERNPHFRSIFEDGIRLLPNGRYRISRSIMGNYFKSGYRFREQPHEHIGLPRKATEEITQSHKDFAFALQECTEKVLVHVMSHLQKTTGSRNLCLSGGVALNCVANGRIVREAGFDKVFIQPASSDAGTSLGAAAYLQFHKLGGDRPEPFTSAFLGPQYSDVEIQRLLSNFRVEYEQLPDPVPETARLLAQGKVVGWFQGRAEFGPRSLGNRSILADPRDANIASRINQTIKYREGFRPLAPAVLEEAMDQYFHDLRESRYMLIAESVRKGKRREIAGVVHVDGSARPQSVSREQHELFHRLISEFAGITGVPVLLNTSFNVAGEAIVMSPRDAIRCFFSSELDVLVLGCLMVKKRL